MLAFIFAVAYILLMMTSDTKTPVHADGSLLGHVFERAQLGVGPFRFVGMEEKAISYPDGTSQAAGTCQYCGTGNCYWIQSADCRKFYVGSDCVGHLGDEKLVAVVMSAERKRKNAQAAARRDAKRKAEREAQRAEVERRMPEYTAALSALESRPHPTEYFANQGRTMADYFRYFERDSRPDYWKQRAAIDAAKEVRS